MLGLATAMATAAGVTRQSNCRDVIDVVLQSGFDRFILLVDEVDQYIALDNGALARQWTDHLETYRRNDFAEQFSVVIAGGIGLLHLAHVLGSGLLARAESVTLSPFDRAQIQTLMMPLEQRGVLVTDTVVDLLLTLSGGNPALATYGCGRVWDDPSEPELTIEEAYADFRARHDDFIRGVGASVSQRGSFVSPARVLEYVRNHAGDVPQKVLRELCADDAPHVDVSLVLRLLSATGLIRVNGLDTEDPVDVYPVSSILNIVTYEHSTSLTPVERLLNVLSNILQGMHRVGRDLHNKEGLLHEDVYNSLLAVALRTHGWSLSREPVQAGGYPDLVVYLAESSHVVIESKLWPNKKKRAVQEQVDDYRLSDTRHSIVIVFGDRATKGWREEYQEEILASRQWVALETPPDLVGRWRVEQHVDDQVRMTDHFLVQLPKRS